MPTHSIEVISTADPSWQQHLQTIEHDFYHLPEYLELEALRSNATPEAIIIRDGERTFFLPYLIRELNNSLNLAKDKPEKINDAISPYGYPGMLVNKIGQNPDFIKKCLALTCELWRQRNICSAFLRLHPIVNSYIDSSLSTTQFSICNQGDVVVIDLDREIDEIWQKTRRNHRCSIKKLLQAGFTAKVVPIDKYLDVFVEIYKETMARVNATTNYYFTHEYFQNLANFLGDRLHVCIVEIDNRVIAATLITESSGIVQYHLGGVRTEFLMQSPATITINTIVKWAKSRGNKYVNLGGGLGGSKDSLYHFKAGFSDLSKSFMTVKTIVDRDRYDRLTDLRAASLGMTLTEIKNESFFPLYRLNKKCSHSEVK